MRRSPPWRARRRRVPTSISPASRRWWAACLSDSITDGEASTPDGERRWPDRLAERLLVATNGRVGTIDTGLVGNSMLGGAPLTLTSPSALARLPRDVLSRPGVHWIIVYEGINDIVYPPDAGDTVAELIAACGQVIARAHAAGVKAFGVTLTPWAGSARPTTGIISTSTMPAMPRSLPRSLSGSSDSASPEPACPPIPVWMRSCAISIFRATVSHNCEMAS